jgi:hypothetical protein
MSIKEVDILFKRGLESLKAGNYIEAEAFFIRAKKLTLELQQKKIIPAD